jgi:hypothetical protein
MPGVADAIVGTMLSVVSCCPTLKRVWSAAPRDLWLLIHFESWATERADQVQI